MRSKVDFELRASTHTTHLSSTLATSKSNEKGFWSVTNTSTGSFCTSVGRTLVDPAAPARCGE